MTLSISDLSNAAMQTMLWLARCGTTPLTALQLATGSV